MTETVSGDIMVEAHTSYMRVTGSSVGVFWGFFVIHYNKYNTIIEHISTPVPTVDNIPIQIYMHMLYSSVFLVFRCFPAKVYILLLIALEQTRCARV